MATVISGTLYYLLRNPNSLGKLTKKLRLELKSTSEIDKESLKKVPYLSEVIDEGLRLFHPLPGNLRRITPPTGCMIGGRFIPGKTVVGVDIYATAHSSENLYKLTEFHPERWSKVDPPEEFLNDNHKAMRLFSIGPRNCIAQNLAYIEMQLVLAVLVFSFDIKLLEESRLWADNVKVFGFIQKRELMVKLMQSLEISSTAYAVIDNLSISISRTHKPLEMLEVDDIAYSREATIGAVRDYYRFLARHFEAVSTRLREVGRSHFITPRCALHSRNSHIPAWNNPPQGSPGCYWADWQKLAADGAEAANAGEDMGEFGENLKGMSELWLEDVPDHVVGLTFGDSYNAHTFLLDTKFGVVHWPDSCGGVHHQANVDNDPSFIEPVWGVDEHAPENEEWRSSSPAWPIPDFFQTSKEAVPRAKVDPHKRSRGH
ncbi:hypothetical protein IFR05_014152 [Cadophora sp. M221]|nr:hypothetical protein IFR05_014152 [Cadophora sp. M221]